ncbi:L,D-peptidoglycan transpeptidase YkuD, ErfK/YbiS/YcfS/YnhG family [Aureimonas jatrophae]|uniref:L,D-peptidoglycan transpeptidase YkuD, ErfK/YbiS/YcfS/YnhG family n=1 Tax=Aureimonas jatrophae TaxID=1166073 RepID=A0A1H0HXQ2_9HYPH|nr:L,D-transpeptidase family protein [Aureimonas jatrophae]SDO23947.1 L,D-peptidoglycan transpeptidase YkuD, ErfK/YbiS/YcfS/YnhG family [Aureimonas jatrophae]
MRVFPEGHSGNQGKSGVILVRTAPGNRSRGIVQAGPLRLPCALGRSGPTSRKREGDGATPIASMRLLWAYRPPCLPGPRPPVLLPTRHTRPHDGWCDAPRHPSYNRPVRLPFPASTESMRRGDRLYDLVVVLDWNLRNRRRFRGSAIFLHVAREGFAPTEGSVALHPRDLLRLAPFLRPGVRLVVLP